MPARPSQLTKRKKKRTVVPIPEAKAGPVTGSSVEDRAGTGSSDLEKGSERNDSTGSMDSVVVEFRNVTVQYGPKVNESFEG